MGVSDLTDLSTIGQLTGTGVLFLVLLIISRVIIKGGWVPRDTVDLLLASRDAEITRAIQRGDEWHAAYETQRHRAELLLDQNNALIEVAKTVEAVVAKSRENAA